MGTISALGLWYVLDPMGSEPRPIELTLAGARDPLGSWITSSDPLALVASIEGYAGTVEVRSDAGTGLLDPEAEPLLKLPVVDGRIEAELTLARGAGRRFLLSGRDLVSQELRVVHDEHPPALEWLDSPPSRVREAQVELRFSVRDEHLSEVRCDGAVLEPGTPEWFYSTTVRLPENGTRRVLLEAVDIAGNVVREELDLVHDGLAPRRIAGAPADGQRFEQGERLALDWTFDEPVSEVRVEGEALDVDADHVRAEGSLLVSEESGRHVLRWSATDLAGNRRVGEFVIEVAVPVELQLEWPDGAGFDADGVAYLGTSHLELRGRLRSARGEEVVLREATGEERARTRIDEQGAFEFDLDLGETGRASLVLEGDGLQHPFTLVADTADPELEWLRAPEIANEGLFLEWSARDAHLSAVRVDGREVEGSEDGHYTHHVPRPLPEEVRVTAVDRGGRTRHLVWKASEPALEASAVPEASTVPRETAYREPAPLLRREALAPGDDPWGAVGPGVRARFQRLGRSLVVDGPQVGALRYPERIVHRQTGLVFRYVPGGRFGLGNADGPEDETPEREVLVEGYYMGETEVSLGAWRLGGGADLPQGEGHGGDEHPVVEVDWSQADAWCRSLGFRLPSEAQWEWAAAGPEERAFPWGDQWQAGAANSGGEDDGWSGAAPVGSAPLDESWCGVLDLAGNVSEWCRDLYSPGYGWVSEGMHDPVGSEGDPGAYVERGGCFDDVEPTSSTYRFGFSPTGLGSLGFRPVLRP